MNNNKNILVVSDDLNTHLDTKKIHFRMLLLYKRPDTRNTGIASIVCPLLQLQEFLKKIRNILIIQIT